MKPDSPMMQRVHRNYSSIIPKKGRIRTILALVIAVLCVKFAPTLLQALPETATPQEKTAATATTQLKTPPPPSKPPVKPNSSTALFTSEDITKFLSRQPACFTADSLTVSDRNDSLDIFTSIDTTLQKQVKKLMRRYHPLYGALLALDPVSGRVKVAVSYTNDSMPDLGGNLCFRSLFPAASVFKTVTAAAAIELAQYSPSCMVEHRGKSHTLYKSQIAEKLAWSVDLSFAKAYARSINAVFARIGIYEIGADQLYHFSKKMGFLTPLPGIIPCDVSSTFYPDSTFALAELASGFNQKTLISPLHGALIAASVIENGAFLVPTLIDSIRQHADSSPVYIRDNTTWCQFIQPSTARQMQKLMRTVIYAGTARKHFRYIRNSRRFDNYLFGGKTGSVDKDGTGRVDWFIGYGGHPENSDERLAIGVVTVHGEYWTVNSAYLAAETFSKYLRAIRKVKQQQQENANAPADTTITPPPT